jgi:hypothetical protein
MAERTGNTALITGASAGLGKDFAHLFAADGHDVVLVARRREKLEQVAAAVVEEHGVEAHVVPADLADAESPQRLYDEVAAKGLTIEYLVNNAGFGSNGAFAELDMARELAIVTVNISALAHLTGLYLPEMLERDSGRILNVGSTAGFLAGPYMATYYASKAFVNHFSEALWHEVNGTNVSVTVSCPGPTATEFAEVAKIDEAKLFKKGGAAKSIDVARGAYKAMHKGKRMIVHGFMNKLNVVGIRMGPRGAAHRIAKRLNQP